MPPPPPPPHHHTQERLHSPQRENPASRTLPAELAKLRSYVEATNTHINHLSSLSEDIIAEQVVDVKHALQDAHRGLERLEAQFAVVGEIKKEVWRTYRRLREFEDKNREGEDIEVRDFIGTGGVGVGGIGVGGIGSIGGPRTGTIRVVPAMQTPSVAGSEAGGGAGRVGTPMPGSENWSVPGEQLEPEDSAAKRDGSVTPGSGEAVQGAIVAAPRIVPLRPVSMPPRYYKEEDSDEEEEEEEEGVREAERVKRRHTTKETGKQERRATPVKPERLSFPRAQELKKTRVEVIESVAREEARGGNGLNDPSRKREGSADGTLISQAVMTADANPHICVPHLAYIKIHEVRDLKLWLSRNGYLHQGKRISKTEKVLHLLTLLQIGCRFESVAVLFSRRPKEVLAACKEVFNGLLELHSETMLPNRKTLHRYVYPHLWHMVHNYGLMDWDWDNKRDQRADDRNYLPWPKDDIRKVLITVNIYVGRYRSQGRFALTGDIMDWGRYIQAQDDAVMFNVPHWIERLQIAPPRAPTRARSTRA